MSKKHVDVGQDKYKRGLSELKKPIVLGEDYDLDRMRLIGIATSLNLQQKEMVEGWLRKGRVQNLTEGLDKIQARIAQDNEQGRRGVERG